MLMLTRGADIAGSPLIPSFSNETPVHWSDPQTEKLQFQYVVAPSKLR